MFDPRKTRENETVQDRYFIPFSSHFLTSRHNPPQPTSRVLCPLFPHPPPPHFPPFFHAPKSWFGGLESAVAVSADACTHSRDCCYCSPQDCPYSRHNPHHNPHLTHRHMSHEYLQLPGTTPKLTTNHTDRTPRAAGETRPILSPPIGIVTRDAGPGRAYRCDATTFPMRTDRHRVRRGRATRKGIGGGRKLTFCIGTDERKSSECLTNASVLAAAAASSLS